MTAPTFPDVVARARVRLPDGSEGRLWALGAVKPAGWRYARVELGEALVSVRADELTLLEDR